MEKWFVQAKKADFNKWSEELDISPVVARIIRNREIGSIEAARKYLYGTMEDCYNPSLLKDMDKAVDYLLKSIDDGEKIRVIGDYDVDGICSAYILTKGISVIGGNVDTVIPHRVQDGYGLNDKLIEDAKRDNVDLIITCDNGISAKSQIDLANSLSIKVIVTDHHEVPIDDNKEEILPDALAVVDPKQRACEYPFKNICGGMVAFKLMQAIYEKTHDDKLDEALSEFTEFAALATVCDVMELIDENRIIVKKGLELMKNSSCEGLRALMEVNELKPSAISAYHLGFVIGPCLNATGRLDTARRALELLNSKTKAEAVTIARELKELNDSRKNLTIKGVAQANEYIMKQELENDKVLVIYLPDVHESIAGIIAGRIREQTCKPTFVLTNGEEDVKGSGRSIDSYNMYEAMTQVKHLFTKFGGHKLAAGLSLKEENVSEFRKIINEKCTLSKEDFISKVSIDVPMPISYANEAIVHEISMLEPFGVGNSKPLFAEKDVTFISETRLGKNKNVAKFNVITSDGKKESLMYFGDLDKFGAFLKSNFGEQSEEKLLNGQGDYKISVTYQLGLNTYNGRTSIQYIIQNFS